MQSSIIITIEGLIGAGKSTLLKQLQLEFLGKNVYFFTEPVTEFQQFLTVDNTILNPLDLYYKNQVFNAFPFQIHVLDCYRTLLDQISNTLSNNPNRTVIVMDRGIYSSYVFTKVLYDKQFITNFGMALFQKKLRDIIKMYYYDTKPFGTDKIFFLDMSVETCQKHIVARNRDSERDMADMISYQELLKKHYLDYFDNFKNLTGSEDNVIYSTSSNYDEIKEQCSNLIKTCLGKTPLQ